MYPVRRQISRQAAPLRRHQTDVEGIVWDALRNRQLDGFKFRRQATIGRYVVDFLCCEAKLVVELDGGQHDTASDARRSAILGAAGYRVIRFWNNDVVTNCAGVLEAIGLALGGAAENKKALTQPSPAKAGEGSCWAR